MRALSFMVWLVIMSSCARFDESKAYRYACTRDAGASECPGGWLCGLEGVCLNPSVGGAHACELGTDCTGGWHCGKSGVCYDRNLVTDVACRADVEQDCAPGWRCGLEEVCHDRDAGAPYRCLTDFECERGWRCDVNQVCVDVALDALRESSGMPSVVALQTAGSGTQAPLALGASLRRNEPTQCRFDFDRQSLVTVTDDSLEKVTAYFGAGRSTSCSDAGFPLDTVSADRAVIPWDGGTPRSVLETNDATYVLSQSGEFHMFSFEPPSTLKPEAVSGRIGFVPQALRPGSGIEDPFILAFDATRVAVFNTRTKTWVSTAVPNLSPGDGGASATINEAVWFGHDCDDNDQLDCATDSDAQHQLVLATTRGVFVAPAQKIVTPTPHVLGAVSPVSLPYSDCWQDNVLRILQVTGDDSTLLTVRDRGFRPEWATVPAISGTPMFSMSCPYFKVVGGRLNGWTYAQGAGLQPVSYYACGGQPQDFRFGSINAYRRNNRIEFESACTREADAGSPELIVQSVTDQTYAIEDTRERAGPYQTDAGLFPSSPQPWTRAVADGRGRIWWAGSTDVRLVPVFPQTAPDVVGGVGNGVFGVVLPRSVPADSILNDEGAFFARTPFGFVNVSDEGITGMVSAASGRPDWVTLALEREPLVIQRQGSSLFNARFLARVPSLKGEPPYASAAATLNNGATLFLIAGFDTVHAAEVTRSFGIEDALDGVDVEVAVVATAPVLVPLPQRTITSLITLGPSMDPLVRARYMEGYLTAAGRVFRFRADNAVVWRHDEVELDGEGEIVRVFADQRRVRVGYRDGKVYSLPSRTLVGPAISANTSTVSDYADLCGNTFALASNGLHRLVATGTGLGTWQLVNLPGSPSTLNGKLHVADQELIVWLESHVFSLRVDCAN
jgi:hypothetical protein